MTSYLSGSSTETKPVDVDVHGNWILKNAHRQTSLKTVLLYIQKDPVLWISMQQSTGEFSPYLQSQPLLAKQAFSGLDKVIEAFHYVHNQLNQPH